MPEKKHKSNNNKMWSDNNVEIIYKFTHNKHDSNNNNTTISYQNRKLDCKKNIKTICEVKFKNNKSDKVFK